MTFTFHHDLTIIFDFIIHTPVAIYALIATLLILFAYLLSICLDEFYLKMLLPITYLCLFGFGLYNYWNIIIATMSFVFCDFTFHGTVIGLMPYVISLVIMLLITFISMFLKKVHLSSKIIHIVAFSFLQFLFFSFAYTIAVAEPALQTVNEIYHNDLLVAILNLSTLIILIWIIILVITSLMRMIYNISDDSFEDDESYYLKRNIAKLELEIQQLKMQSNKDNLEMLRRINKIENSLGTTNTYFLTQMKEITKQVEDEIFFNYIKKLYCLMEENYNIVTSELKSLRRKPYMEIRELKERLEQLESIIFEANRRIAQQLELVKITPEYEIEKMKDTMDQLEILLQRYKNDIDYELIQTRKEFQLAHSHKYRYGYDEKKR